MTDAHVSTWNDGDNGPFEQAWPDEQTARAHAELVGGNYKEAVTEAATESEAQAEEIPTADINNPYQGQYLGE